MTDRHKAVIWEIGLPTGILVAALTLLAVHLLTAAPSPRTEYTAVLLTNGATMYGKLSGLGSKFPVLEDAFTIEKSFDSNAAVENSIVTPRINDWNAPARTILNADHIVSVEPVAMASKLGQLIKQRKR